MMRFGVSMPATDETANLLEVARAVEDRGFESLFLPEHTHIPASLSSKPPKGGDTPRHYFRFIDPFVALGAIAAMTTTLKIGTAVCLVLTRDPIVLAKEVSTLDLLSGGRVLFGVGTGWNKEELANHGVPYEDRWEIYSEKLEAMATIWTHEIAIFTGKHVHFDPLFQWPKPVQSPHPPILVADNRQRAFDELVRVGDEWMPRVGLPGKPFLPHIPTVLRAAKDAGKGQFPVTVFSAPPEPAALSAYEEAGVYRCVFRLEPVPDMAQIEDQLKQMSGAIAGLR
jgi:probable F420-dependent oxidoreductase